MATGTLSPSGKQYFFNIITGAPLAGGFVYTVSAGGVTPGNNVATYQNQALTIQNSNPIQLNGAGYCTIYLVPGQSYKYIVTDANGVPVWTQDGISAVPGSSSAVDIIVTAGENIAAEAPFYVSDGSGGKNQGQAYNATASFPYASSTASVVGLAVAAIASGAQGSGRICGQLTVAQTLTPGAPYFIAATAGTITSTAPSNARFIGGADGVNSITVVPSPPATGSVVDNGLCDFRLTLTTMVPVTTADVTAAVTLYCTPYRGNRIALFDSSGNPTLYTSAELSIAVPASVSQMYDVWGYVNTLGVPALELLAWTNDTTRATALVNTVAPGIYTKSGDATRRYLGSFRTTAVNGQTEDSLTKRFVWNYYNRVPRTLTYLQATASWNYTTSTWRQANAGTNTNAKVEFVIGVAESPVTVAAQVTASNTNAVVEVAVGIGLDSTTVPSGLVPNTVTTTANALFPMRAEYTTVPAVGYHAANWLEKSDATGTTTWYGTGGLSIQSGIMGLMQ